MRHAVIEVGVAARSHTSILDIGLVSECIDTICGECVYSVDVVVYVRELQGWQA